MKKIIYAGLFLALFQGVFAFRAEVAPFKIGVNTQQNVFVITVSDCAVSNASFEFSIPPEFYTAPEINGTVSGAVSAVIMRGGTTAEEVSNANMSVNGFLVSVSGVTLSANDTLLFTYGKTDVASGLYGITAPPNQTDLYFGVKYSEDNWATYISADEAPKVRILFMDLVKSVSASNIMAGMTFTYTLTYTNMSPYHYAQNLRIWDTMPQGIAYVTQFSTPLLAASVSNNVITFEPGTLMYQQSGVINIVARALTGIISSGTETVNRAYLSGNDMYTNTLSAYAEVKTSVSGIKYETVLTASPSYAVSENPITVILSVKNTGNAAGTNLQAGTLSVTPSGAAEYVSGPVPPYYSYFGQGEIKTFTWAYKAVQPGSLYFTASVSAGETYSTVEKGAIVSNIVNVFEPTPTPEVPTPVPSVTADITPGTTPGITPVPSETPDAKTDKNYFNPDKNEKVTVYFTAKKPGKISVKVVNLNGEKIRAFEINAGTAGGYSAEWDGRNEAGKTAAKGMYFVVIKQEEGTEMVRVAVIK